MFHCPQVKASEVVVSDSYKVGLTLRFPRVEKIRTDRCWHQTMTLNEVLTLRDMAKGKLVTRHCSALSTGDGPTAKRPRMSKSILGVASHFMAADVSEVVRSTTYFDGKEICVYAGDGESNKQELEIAIAGASGEPVQHAGPKTLCIIAAGRNLRVKSVGDRWDVVRPSWIRRCVDSASLLPLRPQDMLVTSRSTAAVMALSFDQYGSSLTEPTTEEQVPLILNRVKELVNVFFKKKSKKRFVIEYWYWSHFKDGSWDNFVLEFHWSRERIS